MTSRFRWEIFLSVLILAACSPQSARAPDLPESISPGWTLESIASANPNLAPDSVKSAHPQRAWLATYAGPVKAHARIWALPGPVGLELIQHWRAEPNTVVFYTEAYFVAVDYAPVQRESATALVVGLEKALRTGNRRRRS